MTKSLAASRHRSPYVRNSPVREADVVFAGSVELPFTSLAVTTACIVVVDCVVTVLAGAVVNTVVSKFLSEEEQQ